MARRSGKKVVDTSWAQGAVASGVRQALLTGVFKPVMNHYAHIRVFGAHHLDGFDGPMIITPNHNSHTDTPSVLMAMPKRIRKKTIVLAAADYFYTNFLAASAVSLVLGTVPLERSGVSLDSSSRIDRLIDAGYSVVIFPEGTRSRTGEMGRMRPGAAYMAMQHKIPVLPVRMFGTRGVMPAGAKWLKKGQIDVHIGELMYAEPDDTYRGFTMRIRRAVEQLGSADPGEPTAPEPDDREA